jgi:O-antigen/teichoic acid export membrane protein
MADLSLDNPVAGLPAAVVHNVPVKPFVWNDPFETSAEGGGLLGAAVRGVGVNVLAQILCFVIQLMATMVLARLLTPADFGIVTMVTVFSLLLANVGFNGFTEAIIQRDQIDHGLMSNLFWINLSITLMLTIGFASAGSLLARLYGNPRVLGVAVGMSATIFLTGVPVIHLALLQRAMRFSTLSRNDVISRVVSAVVAILLGWARWGYWALVAGAIALPLTTAFGAWASCRWMPGLPRRREGTWQMVKFTANTFGYFAANYCTRNLDNLLVGWAFGPQSVGFYKKAYDLSVLPASQLGDPLHRVAVPALSRVAGDLKTYRRYVLRSLSTLALTGMGLGGVFALVGKDLIYILLGPRWGESGRIFTFFGPGIGIMLLYSAHGWIAVSAGRVDRWFRWGIVEFTVTGLFFLLALHWGPAGFAVAWVCSVSLLTLPALWYAGRPAGLGLASIVDAIWRSVVAAALAGYATFAASRAVPSFVAAGGVEAAMIRAVLVAAVFGALYLVAVILLHGGFEPLHQVAALVQDMLPGSRRVKRGLNAKVVAEI